MYLVTRKYYANFEIEAQINIAYWFISPQFNRNEPNSMNYLPVNLFKYKYTNRLHNINIINYNISIIMIQF